MRDDLHLHILLIGDGREVVELLVHDLRALDSWGRHEDTVGRVVWCRVAWR
ncbi:hypothetical protein FHS43_004244 [Streptosporangium becharense]|uniref:Uncharacterized protein n=1 Tax=Streptosporangium becharense TaxID=1816182 RepID=A0A7W9IDF4_9ACTN|nr:hypothetical protein [Streptosporangium becharense]MBB5818226.1 hypothetical protein [Streptosporangium becharense]